MEKWYYFEREISDLACSDAVYVFSYTDHTSYWGYGSTYLCYAIVELGTVLGGKWVTQYNV